MQSFFRQRSRSPSKRHKADGHGDLPCSEVERTHSASVHTEHCGYPSYTGPSSTIDGIVDAERHRAVVERFVCHDGDPTKDQHNSDRDVSVSGDARQGQLPVLLVHGDLCKPNALSPVSPSKTADKHDLQADENKSPKRSLLDRLHFFKPKEDRTEDASNETIDKKVPYAHAPSGVPLKAQAILGSHQPLRSSVTNENAHNVSKKKRGLFTRQDHSPVIGPPFNVSHNITAIHSDNELSQWNLDKPSTTYSNTTRDRYGSSPLKSTRNLIRTQSLRYFDHAAPPTPPAKNTPPQQKVESSRNLHSVRIVDQTRDASGTDHECEEETGFMSIGDKVSPTRYGNYGYRGEPMLVDRCSVQSSRAYVDAEPDAIDDSFFQNLRQSIDARGLNILNLSATNLHDSWSSLDTVRADYSPSVYSDDWQRSSITVPVTDLARRPVRRHRSHKRHTLDVVDLPILLEERAREEEADAQAAIMLGVNKNRSNINESGSSAAPTFVAKDNDASLMTVATPVLPQHGKTSSYSQDRASEIFALSMPQRTFGVDSPLLGHGHQDFQTRRGMIPIDSGSKQVEGYTLPATTYVPPARCTIAGRTRVRRSRSAASHAELSGVKHLQHRFREMAEFLGRERPISRIISESTSNARQPVELTSFVKDSIVISEESSETRFDDASEVSTRFGYQNCESNPTLLPNHSDVFFQLQTLDGHSQCQVLECNSDDQDGSLLVASISAPSLLHRESPQEDVAPPQPDAEPVSEDEEMQITPLRVAKHRYRGGEPAAYDIHEASQRAIQGAILAEAYAAQREQREVRLGSNFSSDGGTRLFSTSRSAMTLREMAGKDERAWPDEAVQKRQLSSTTRDPAQNLHNQDDAASEKMRGLEEANRRLQYLYDGLAQRVEELQIQMQFPMPRSA